MQTAPGASLIDAAPPAPTRARLLTLLAGVTLLVYAADQVTKVLATDRLRPGVPVEVVGTLLQLRLIRNPGAAFSLATGMTWLLTLVAVGVVVVVLRSARRIGSPGWALALGLLLGGALGNLTDRLVRAPGFARGHVVDFIDYNGWFVGNVADIAIVVATVVVGLLSMRGIGLDGSRTGGPTESHSGTHRDDDGRHAGE
jgi:signal peptidase II